MSRTTLYNLRGNLIEDARNLLAEARREGAPAENRMLMSQAHAMLIVQATLWAEHEDELYAEVLDDITIQMPDGEV